ncbi:MAG: adenosine kinase [Candidatus Woesearchaeota archaeon]
MKTLFSLENTIVDYVAHVEDSFLEKYALSKGGFNLLGEDKVKEIGNNAGEAERHAGGAGANVLHGFHNLGGEALFCGSIGTDEDSEYYTKQLKKAKIKLALAEKEGPNGICYALITPDNQRTFALSRGNSISLCIKDIPFEDIRGCWGLHTTAYALDHPEETVEAAMKEARGYNVGVSFDLASVASIDRHSRRMENLIKMSCNIVFANEEEAFAFTGYPEDKAAREIAKMCNIAIVNLGKCGTYVAFADELHRVHAYDVKVANTNGAGDGFVAGFLYAMMLGHSPRDSAFSGSYYASKIVEIEGTKLDYRPDIETVI